MKNIRYYVFFALDLLKGGKHKKAIDETMKINTEFSKYKSIHDDALRKLLAHACTTVPYYKKYCGKSFD